MTSPNWPGIIESLRQRLVRQNREEGEPQVEQVDPPLNSRVLERFLRERHERETESARQEREQVQIRREADRLERDRLDRLRDTYRAINRGFPTSYNEAHPIYDPELHINCRSSNPRPPWVYVDHEMNPSNPNLTRLMGDLRNVRGSNYMAVGGLRSQTDSIHWDEAIPELKVQYSERFTSNAKILKKLYHYVYKYPDVRFGQLLVTCGILVPDVTDGEMRIADPFNEESAITLSNMKDPSGEE